MGAISGCELQLRQKEGTGILVTFNAKSQQAADHQIAWVEGVAEDITERKVLEMEMQYHTTELNRYALSLTQTNKKLNLFSRITRHDILNQLTALAGYLDLIREESEIRKSTNILTWKKGSQKLSGDRSSLPRTIRKLVSSPAMV